MFVITEQKNVQNLNKFGQFCSHLAIILFEFELGLQIRSRIWIQSWIFELFYVEFGIRPNLYVTPFCVFTLLKIILLQNRAILKSFTDWKIALKMTGTLF